MNRNHIQYGLVLCFAFAFVFLVFPANAYADGTSDTEAFMNSAFDFGATIGTQAGGGTGLPAELYNLLTGLMSAAHSIIIIMTAVAGAMVVFGMEDGKKIIWQYMLGIGLAINFAGFLFELWGTYLSSAISTPKPLNTAELDKIVQLKTQGGFDILSNFMAYYTTLVVEQGKAVLVPIAFRMTLIFAALDASVKLAMDLISGDKIKFMISTILKVGFYMFLIENWITIAEAISKFFQTVGFMASGVADSADNTMGLKADSITDDAFRMWSVVISGAGKGADASGASTVLNKVAMFTTSPIIAIGSVVIMFVTMACLFLTAVEMFMARIEFYTMMLISIIMIPFGVIEQLNFLGKQAVSSLFNLGAKVMVIAFIQGVATVLLHNYAMKLWDNTDKSLVGNFPVLFQILLLSVILLVITKKIPDLISGFLQGSPNLSGGSMVEQAKSAVQTAGKVTGGAGEAAGMVAGAYAQAKGNATASGKTGAALKMSTMAGTVGNLAGAGLMAAATGNPLVQGVNSGLVKALGAGGLVSSLNLPPEKDKNATSLPGFRSILSGGSDEKDGFNQYHDTKNNITPDKQNGSQNTDTSKPSAETAASGSTTTTNASNTDSAGTSSTYTPTSSNPDNSATQKSTGSANANTDNGGKSTGSVNTNPDSGAASGLRRYSGLSRSASANTTNTTNSGDKGNTGNTGNTENTGNATNQQPNLQGGRETKKDNDKPFQPK